MNKGPGLYIHIPFCKKKCDYCDFVSFPIDCIDDVRAGGRLPLPDQYLAAIKNEMDAIGRDTDNYVRAGFKPAPSISFSTIYIGGGTPTILTDDELKKLGGIIDNVRAGGRLPRQYTEFTAECNPGTLTRSKLKVLKQIGVNRLSIGCQSFNDDELKTLGRIHSSKEILESIENARAEGFDNINLDLIFALPGQTLDSWKKTLNAAISLDPEHISAYDLQIEAGTPFYDRYGPSHDNNVRAQHVAPLPSNDDEYQMYKATIDLLKSRGYHHYEISNFAKPGHECAHNINYWKNGDYTGAGLNASSHMNGRRFQNTSSLDAYLSGPLDSKKEEERKDTDEVSETVFMGLRLLEGLDTLEFEKRFNMSINTLYRKQIAELIDLGLIETSDNNIRLSAKGLFLANDVFEKFV